MAGCATDNVWREPRLKPEVDYTKAELMRLRKLPVFLEVESPELAMVNERGLSGGVSATGRFPIRKVMQHECERFISQNFRSATAYDSSYVIMRVTLSRVMVMQKWSEVVSDLSYKIELTHPTDATVRDYFAKTYGESAANRKSKEKGIVPESVYFAAQKVLGDFAKDICGNPTLITRLERLIRDSQTPINPSRLLSFDLAQGKKGIYPGKCVYECNDDLPEKVSIQAKEYIFDSCWKKLGITKERVRVVYDAERLENGVWTFSFRTFGRMELAFTYDPESRQGVCTADLGLVRKGVQEASEVMRRHIFEQMKTYGGAVSDSTADLKTLVRFGEFKTDAQNELLTVTFSVVY